MDADNFHLKSCFVLFCSFAFVDVAEHECGGLGELRQQHNERRGSACLQLQ